MTDSILDSVKKAVGVAADYHEFDVDILMHINSTLAILTQLGIGPTSGFLVEDEEALWDDLVSGDHRYNLVKTYLYLQVRLLFDPPSASFHVTSMEKKIDELTWRINVAREVIVHPYPDADPPEDGVIDGGAP